MSKIEKTGHKMDNHSLFDLQWLTSLILFIMLLIQLTDSTPDSTLAAHRCKLKNELIQLVF